MDKLDVKSDMIFMAADGDGIGKKVGRAVIANDVEQLHKISNRIDAAQDFILHWCKHHDGIKVSGGGDEFTAAIPKEAERYVESLRKDIEHAFGYTISVGLGSNLAEAGTALLVAKLRGKDRIVKYSDEIKEDIKKAKRRVREKRATPDEYKLSEAYLKKSEDGSMESTCPYCEQTDGVDPTHCKYCHDAEAQEGQEPCKYCAQGQSIDGDVNCPYCQDTQPSDEANACPYCRTGGGEVGSGPQAPNIAGMDDTASKQLHPQGQDAPVADQDTKIKSPDSSNAQAPAGSEAEKQQYQQMGMNPPIIGKPAPGAAGAAGEGMANPGDASGAPVEPASAEGQEVESGAGIMPDEGAHSTEQLQAIAQQIEGQDAEGNPEQKPAANQIDEANMPTGTMEGNVSRAPGFEENTPGDMGLDETHAEEENPDLSSVLKEGLDSQADEIQKDKVREMVGQALNGFKASKDILERAREQAPDFYRASISMLAAMIKMAEMLGLSGGANVGEIAPGAESGQESGQDVQNEWHDPFPTHPDKGGEPKPGHHAPGQEAGAGAPKDRTPVGQPIGKLPSKATEHVARTPTPPGAVNAKGQQKVIDPKTGKTRWIDRKQGMVQSATGVPVKAPGRGSDESKN